MDIQTVSVFMESAAYREMDKETDKLFPAAQVLGWRSVQGMGRTPNRGEDCLVVKTRTLQPDTPGSNLTSTSQLPRKATHPL